MASQPHRSHKSSPRRRPVIRTPLRCDHLEDRVTPVLFTAQPPMNPGGLNNNGFVAVADFDKNGLPDILLTNQGSDFGIGAANTITVLYAQQAAPYFKVAYPTGGTNVSFAAIGDINGDTYPDVVATNQNNGGTNIGSFAVFQNDGTGNLVKVGTYSTGDSHPSWVGLADVTGDAVLDVVVGHFGQQDPTGQTAGGSIRIFQGQGNFTYSSTPIVLNNNNDVSFIPTALAVADFDRDGIMDIAAVVPGVPADHGQVPPNGTVNLFRGTGSGGFAAPIQIDSGGINPVNVIAADLNGDLKPELIVSNTGDASVLGPTPDGQPLWAQQSVEVLPNTSTIGSGNVSFGLPTFLAANLDGPFAAAVGDFDLDGKQDVAVVNYGDAQGFTRNASVAVYLRSNTGAGLQFSPPSPGTFTTNTNLPGGQYLAVGDFDGNGSPDLVVAHASNVVGRLTNTTTPPTSAPTVAGVVVNGGDQRSMVRSIAVTFSGPVTFANNNAAAAFTLTRLTNGGGTVGLSAAVSTDGQGRTVVTLTFTGTTAVDLTSALNNGQLSLADGRFQLSIADGAVTGQGGTALDGDGNGTAGGAYVSPTDTSGGGTGQLRLFRLFGDATGNGVVDLADLGVFRGTFNAGTGNPLYLEYLDSDHSGTVDLADLGEFRSRFNATVF